MLNQTHCATCMLKSTLHETYVCGLLTIIVQYYHHHYSLRHLKYVHIHAYCIYSKYSIDMYRQLQSYANKSWMQCQAYYTYFYPSHIIYNTQSWEMYNSASLFVCTNFPLRRCGHRHLHVSVSDMLHPHTYMHVHKETRHTIKHSIPCYYQNTTCIGHRKN